MMFLDGGEGRKGLHVTHVVIADALLYCIDRADIISVHITFYGFQKFSSSSHMEANVDKRCIPISGVDMCLQREIKKAATGD